MRMRLFDRIVIRSPRVAPVRLDAVTASALRSITAAVELPEGEIPWWGVLVIEGIETGDERIIMEDALTWAALPLPLTDNHDMDRLIGRIDEISREGTTIMGRGVFDDSEAGREAARQVVVGLRRGLSVDLDEMEGEIVVEQAHDPEGGPVDPSDEEIVIPFGNDLMRVTKGRVRGAALCTIAAFVDTQITLDVAGVVTPGSNGDAPAVGVAASAHGHGACSCGGSCSTCSAGPPVLLHGQRRLLDAVALHAAAPPVLPPSEWFADPGFGGPEDERLEEQDDGSYACPLTVVDDCRVFGHLTGSDCHVGYRDSCVLVGETSRDFSRFNRGRIPTADGGYAYVGQITLVGGHADPVLSADAAVAHYDDTRSGVCDVTVGWDALHDKPWFAGAIRPGVTPEQLRVLQASGVSGDWRLIRGELRLIAALVVNVPGWGIQRRPRLLVASGEVMALISAAVLPLSPQERVEREVGRLRAEVTRLRQAVEPLAPLAAERVAERLVRA